jgi:methylenetetrahydrofolate dehydrogenase (NADP+) / methenyltetrahydrofolate cyclohydrolase
MATILDGSAFAETIRAKAKEDRETLNKFGIDVGLALLLVGENPASRQYFLATVKAAKKVGIHLHEYFLPESVSVNEVLNRIHSINDDERVNGLLVLFPLPRKINARRVVNAIRTEKDIDGLGSLAIGRLAADESTFQIFKEGAYERLYEAKFTPATSSFLPCTPFGVIRLLEHYQIPLKGKHVVIVGKSLAVGKPLSLMFLAKESTVTLCHRETSDLAHFTRQADIVCSATGVTELIKGDMIKKGAVVVDVGINILSDGRIVGDIDFSSARQRAAFITPVPGGVGPVTIAILLENTVRSAKLRSMLNDPLSYPF